MHLKVENSLNIQKNILLNFTDISLVIKLTIHGINLHKI